MDGNKKKRTFGATELIIGQLFNDFLKNGTRLPGVAQIVDAFLKLYPVGALGWRVAWNGIIRETNKGSLLIVVDNILDTSAGFSRGYRRV